MLTWAINKDFCFHMTFWLWVNPSGVIQNYFHLTFDSQKPRFLAAWSVCCAVWLRVLEHISKLWVGLLVTPWLVGESVVLDCKGLALLATNQRGERACIFKGRVSPVIYSSHTDKVRHGHCLCTWAFIKQPGWALCRRHSNVQGAD